uniref:Uncharacterized protein n=1 Tax=Meloidogyne enterolobii TaxID=390850 RepID=A0A6V7URQ6_MELEN|nr:unnamed protein product [Meloidogyne enterolobii]
MNKKQLKNQYRKQKIQKQNFPDQGVNKVRKKVLKQIKENWTKRKLIR